MPELLRARICCGFVLTRLAGGADFPKIVYKTAKSPKIVYTFDFRPKRLAYSSLGDPVGVFCRSGTYDTALCPQIDLGLHTPLWARLPNLGFLSTNPPKIVYMASKIVHRAPVRAIHRTAPPVAPRRVRCHR